MRPARVRKGFDTFFIGLLHPHLFEQLVSLRNLAFLRVAQVNEDTITQYHVLALSETYSLFFVFHIGEAGPDAAKRIGGHQTVSPAVPTAGQWIVRRGENRNAGGLAIHRPGIIAPRRDAAPALFLAHFALGVGDMAFAALVLAHAVGHAHTES